MTLARFLVVLLGAALAPLLLSLSAEAGEVGVTYGREASDLPRDQGQVVNLLKNNGITMVRIYDADRDVLRSLANTGIKVMVMLPNDDLARGAASDLSRALDWVRNNVAAYLPATKITGIAVGNEVFVARSDLNSQLVRFMNNVHAALEQLGLADTVKVSTPIAFSAITDSFPPSKGRFVNEVADSVMRPMLQFLQQTGSFLAINLYPHIAELDNPAQIRNDYALGHYVDGVVADGKTYHSLLDAQLDATYSAMAKLGFSGSRRRLAGSRGVKVYVTETGRPSRGGVHHGGRRLADGDGGDPITVANAQIYNNYVINRVLAGNTGTPQHPDADMDVFIFALFNENGKAGDEMEKNFGLFYPDMTKVYQVDFHGGPTESWCVANAAVGDQRLQAALDWACGNGADCSNIQPGASCFQPDTKVAHATYAFNDYYQRKGKASGTCDFAGAASVVYQAPSEYPVVFALHKSLTC
ncbi:hypothetical protein PR202_ga29687 [Eleusine coracana subsp. coracana]|uniref:X8 domain-containing protein n=1 Tax=Eleusine coracana subsp. coracana TaxID=191504 RepID=A0AAV5DK97_ELECO|nr:hypothetical protein PR202_ga29687 [Eleusine coracana subsp. coracana]